MNALANIARYPDWPMRLAGFIQARMKTPFAWGQNDCCSFAGDAVQLMTGVDPMRELRGRYATERGAQRLIKQAGGFGPLVCRYLGPPMENRAAAGRGDVVMLPVSDAGPGLGICVGSDVAVAGTAGVVLIDISSALCAWKV